MSSAQLMPWPREPMPNPMIAWTAPPSDCKPQVGTLHKVLPKIEDQELKTEIEQAQQLLTLKADWDGEGSPAYSEDTLDRAVAFLTMHSEQLKSYGRELPVPKIGPGPDGSIDIHWKQQSWELLVNIPADANEMAAFYGDNYGAQEIKGSLDPNAFKLGVVTWLMQ